MLKKIISFKKEIYVFLSASVVGLCVLSFYSEFKFNQNVLDQLQNRCSEQNRNPLFLYKDDIQSLKQKVRTLYINCNKKSELHQKTAILSSHSNGEIISVISPIADRKLFFFKRSNDGKYAYLNDDNELKGLLIKHGLKHLFTFPF